MSSNAKNIKLIRYDDLFESTMPGKGHMPAGNSKLPLAELHPFKNHPFKPYNEEKMQEMMESIKRNGVLMPILVRPEKNSNGFEIISGHNRVEAARKLGLIDIPATIRELDDETATIVMVDSNLRQRDKLLPSEKAFAYKMKLEAIKRQGERTDLTSGQFVPKLKGKQAGEMVAEKAERMKVLL